jgi:hypothetical protein
VFCVGSGGSCSYCDRLVVLSWEGAWRGGVVLEMCAVVGGCKLRVDLRMFRMVTGGEWVGIVCR